MDLYIIQLSWEIDDRIYINIELRTQEPKHTGKFNLPTASCQTPFYTKLQGNIYSKCLPAFVKPLDLIFIGACNQPTRH